MSKAWLRAELQAQATRQFTEPLLSYIPRVSPRLDSPTWMGPYIEILERAVNVPLREVVAGPPQHGKTECSIHGLVRAMQASPERRHGYATYSAKRAGRVERKARMVAQRAGLKGWHYRQDYWLNERTGGSIVWVGRNAGFGGEPIDGILLVDDIIKDRREADSATIIEAVSDWFDDVAEPRCHPSASIIVMMTRWSKRDLSGLLVSRGWPYTNLKALADGQVDEHGIVIDDPLHRKLGEPLCPARKSRAALEQKRKTNIFSFASLYQGEPRPRGGTVFGPATYYAALPKEYRAGYGVDLSYTARTSSDFSVCIEGWMTRERMPPDEAHDKAWVLLKLYIVRIDRAQVQAPEFSLVLKRRWRERRGPMRWYCATSEYGAGQFIKKLVPSFQIELASADKYIRATPAAEAWNAGNIMVPSRAFLGLDEDDLEERTPDEWEEFENEVSAFTGVNDAQDDQIDALAALWDALAGAGVSVGTDGDGSGGNNPTSDERVNDRWGHGGKGFG